MVQPFSHDWLWKNIANKPDNRTVMSVRALAARSLPGTPEFGVRLAQLLAGLVLYGVALSCEVLAGLGLDPWDVFHQGIARQTHMAIGTWVVIVGVAVMLLWIPLRLRPGIGTVCNALIIGAVMNLVLAITPVPQAMPLRVALLVTGVLLCGVATGAYIGAGLGAGPRDGLMVGIAARGHSIRVVRTGIEMVVLGAGFLLGGTIGIGTLVYALSIGPIAHVTIPWFTRRTASSATR
jgi:uncharacterized membrane protein YczE